MFRRNLPAADLTECHKLPGGIRASQVIVLTRNRIHKYGIEFFKLIIDDSVTAVR